MGAAVKTKCSECGFEHHSTLTPDQKEIVCLTCGRRMANLTNDELNEIEATQKKQRTMTIISLVCFAFAVVCLFMWIGGTPTWVSTDDQQYWQALGTTPDGNQQMVFGAIIMGLATLVFGILGSLRRFVVEY